MRTITTAILRPLQVTKTLAAWIRTTPAWIERSTAMDERVSSSPELMATVEMPFKAIGTVESWFKTKNGTPRQAGIVPQSKAVIHLRKDLFNNPQHAVDGIAAYSHIW